MGSASSTDLYLTIAILSGLVVILIAFLIDLAVQIVRQRKRGAAIATGTSSGEDDEENKDDASETSDTRGDQETIFNAKDNDEADATISSDMEMARIRAAQNQSNLSMKERTKLLLSSK